MSANTEEYLEALYTLTQNGQAATTSDVSKRLNIAPASVTEMLKKLADINCFKENINLSISKDKSFGRKLFSRLIL